MLGESSAGAVHPCPCSLLLLLRPAGAGLAVPWGRLSRQGDRRLCRHFLAKPRFHAKLLICFTNCQIQPAKPRPPPVAGGQRLAKGQVRMESLREQRVLLP